MVLQAVSARFARLLAAVCVTALSVLTVGAASARAAESSLTLSYACSFPVIGSLPVSVTYGQDLPASVTQGVLTSPRAATAHITVPAIVTLGLNVVGAATVSGSAAGDELVTNGAARFGGSVRYSVPGTPVPASGAFTMNATGTFPTVLFPNKGTADIMVGDLSLTLTPRDSHGRPTALGTFTSPCTPKAGQDTMLGKIPVLGRAATTTALAASPNPAVEGMPASITAVTSSANPSIQGQMVTYTAMVSPAGTGRVTFNDGGTPVSGCTAQKLNRSGQATCEVTYAATGIHSITAVYSGNPGNPGSTSAVLTQRVVVDRADLSVQLSMPARAADGAIVTQTVSVTNQGPAPATSQVTALSEPSQLAVMNADGALVRGQLLTWSRPSLAPGETVTFTVTVQVAPQASGTAQVQAGTLSVTPDPNMVNNLVTGQMGLG